MTKPKEDFIRRGIDNELAEILKYIASGVEEIVNFGSNIIYWDLNREGGNDEEDLPPILFLRNFLEEIDAISLLIKSSSIDSCKNLQRTALENVLFIEFLLQEDSRNRALSYLLWRAIKTNRLFALANPVTSEYKALLLKYQKDKFLKNSKPRIIEDAGKLLELRNQMFDLPKYRPIVQEYENTKTRIKNPAWFALFNGPKNLEELAKKVGLEALYEVLYRGLSDSIHGTDIIDGKIAQLGTKVGIDQIRSPVGAETLALNCYYLSVVVFKSYLQSRLPEKINEYNSWYRQIRNFFFELQKRKIIVPGD